MAQRILNGMMADDDPRRNAASIVSGRHLSLGFRLERCRNAPSRNNDTSESIALADSIIKMPARKVKEQRHEGRRLSRIAAPAKETPRNCGGKSCSSKFHSASQSLGVLVSLLIGLNFSVVNTLAAPDGEPDSSRTGRSATIAARLKKNPTAPWIAHYLPDDRYKILGRVWKYVSTETDEFYHAPNSIEMLRQSASSVIGFASKEEAEEAGYRAGPSVAAYELTYSQTIATARGEAAGLGPIVSQNIVNRTGTARWITLSDGVSQALLPPGWSRASRTIIEGGKTMFFDFLRPLIPRNGRRKTLLEEGVMISFLRVPGGWGEMTSAEWRRGVSKEILSGALERMGAAKQGANSVKRNEASLIIADATLDGVAGFSIRRRDGRPFPATGVDNDLFNTRFAPVVKTTVGVGETMIGVSVAVGRSQATAARIIVGSLRLRSSLSETGDSSGQSSGLSDSTLRQQVEANRAAAGAFRGAARSGSF